MSDAVVEQLQRHLERDARFSAWQITSSRGRSTQRFDVFGIPEVKRIVETERHEVRVHVQHPAQDGQAVALGESSFVVAPARDLTAQLDAAYRRALLVRNRPWTLPDPTTSVIQVATLDPRIVEDPADACDGVASSLQRALSSSVAECCAAEMFADFRRVELVNSRGLSLSREETHTYVEYVLLQRGAASDEVETYQSKQARRLEDLDLEATVHGDLVVGAAAQEASLPQTGIVDVVIGDQGVEELFDAFSAHATGPAAFEGWSRFHAGRPIIEDPVGDALTLVSDATIPLGLHSFAFDDVGLAGARVELIRDGVFVQRSCDQRYGCWLGTAPTGSFGNTVVASGARSEAELLEPGERPLYHLLRFSQLSPHGTSGSFSGEVRLGYRIERTPTGLVRTPIRGGSISGDVFSAFRNAFFSQERVVRGRTHAPRAVRLHGVQLTGD